MEEGGGRRWKEEEGGRSKGMWVRGEMILNDQDKRDFSTSFIRNQHTIINITKFQCSNGFTTRPFPFLTTPNVT
jgi:hypothetical protein